ncbi:MAG: hypothetical protein AAF667_19840 [Pseudomonadota bacterium]
MNFLQGALLSFAAYFFLAIVLFGGLLRSIGFLTFWNDRLGIPNWHIFIALGVGVGIGIALLSWRTGLKPYFTPAIFVVTAIVCTTVSLASYLEARRSKEIKRFEPDRAIRASFFSSLRNAPADFQLFLHGAALKDCIPFGWSYRTMTFYELPSNVAVNVLPPAWVDECQIKRTR